MTWWSLLVRLWNMLWLRFHRFPEFCAECGEPFFVERDMQTHVVEISCTGCAALLAEHHNRSLDAALKVTLAAVEGRVRLGSRK